MPSRILRDSRTERFSHSCLSIVKRSYITFYIYKIVLSVICSIRQYKYIYIYNIYCIGSGNEKNRLVFDIRKNDISEESSSNARVPPPVNCARTKNTPRTNRRHDREIEKKKKTKRAYVSTAQRHRDSPVLHRRRLTTPHTVQGECCCYYTRMWLLYQKRLVSRKESYGEQKK